MRCVILNRNYPPNAGITGYSASELSAYLNEHGVDVHIVTVGGNYQGGVRSDTLNQSAEIHHVRNIYDGKRKIVRLLASLVEGRNMAKKAASLGIAPVITLTDPPLLNYWVARFCRRRRIPWIYWSMDIYPEAFVAAGLTKADAFFYRRIKKGLLQSPPAHLIALGVKQAEYLQKDYSKPVATSILPCGIEHIERPDTVPAWLPPRGKISLCYIGNLGQAHDPRFVETVIAALDPAKHHFILSVYGIHAPRLLKYAAQFEHVTVLSEVKRSELGWIDIHLASLDAAWDHVCVPSKAVSAVCAGSCLFLCASDFGDNQHLLRDATWKIEPGPDMQSSVARIIGLLTPLAVTEKRKRAIAISRKLLAMKSGAMAEILDAVRMHQRIPES